MINCFSNSDVTSVCVQLFTSDSPSLTTWIHGFRHGHCHVHVHSICNRPTYKDELRGWLGSPLCYSAVILIDSRMNQALDTEFLALCAKAKTQGVFIGLLMSPEINADYLLTKLNPNWKLKIHDSLDVITRQVNEILGVVRFTPFVRD